jgi:mono/diheme cytochrome c family protein
MPGNLLAILGLYLLFVCFVYLALRSLRARNLILRIGGTALAGILALVVGLLAAVMARGAYLLYAPVSTPQMEVNIDYSPERLARGEHLAVTLCASCHSETGGLPLVGGKNLSEDIGVGMGDLYPPNITSGGRVASWSDAEVVRFFRYGVLPEGRRTVMPVKNMSNLSDEDLYSVIVFLRSQPPFEGTKPDIRFSPIGLMLVGANVFNITFEPKTGPVSAPPRGPTAEYGRYIVSYNDCVDCHGPNLDGKLPVPVTIGPDLRSAASWTRKQFVSTLRTGITPYGTELEPPMPWKQFGKLDDDELAAIHEFLMTLPVDD